MIAVETIAVEMITVNFNFHVKRQLPHVLILGGLMITVERNQHLSIISINVKLLLIFSYRLALKLSAFTRMLNLFNNKPLTDLSPSVYS